MIAVGRQAIVAQEPGWPEHLDIETSETEDVLVEINQKVAMEYASVREKYKAASHESACGCMIQRAWRNYKTWKRSIVQLTMMRVKVEESLNNLRERLRLFRETGRLAPTVEELAKMGSPEVDDVLEKLGLSPDEVERGKISLRVVTVSESQDHVAVKPLASSFGSTRIALMVTNERPRQPASDRAHDGTLQRVLQKAGFIVLRVDDPSLEELRTAVETFSSLCNTGTTALFYFRGGTINIRKPLLTPREAPHSDDDDDNEPPCYYDTYLVPADMRQTLQDVDHESFVSEGRHTYECFSLDTLIEKLQIVSNVLLTTVLFDDCTSFSRKTCPRSRGPLSKGHNADAVSLPRIAPLVFGVSEEVSTTVVPRPKYGHVFAGCLCACPRCSRAQSSDGVETVPASLAAMITKPWARVGSTLADALGGVHDYIQSPRAEAGFHFSSSSSAPFPHYPFTVPSNEARVRMHETEEQQQQRLPFKRVSVSTLVLMAAFNGRYELETERNIDCLLTNLRE